MAHEVITTYQDDAGKRSTASYFIAEGLTLAQIIEGIRIGAVIIDAVSQAVLTVINFIQALDLSGLTGNAALTVSDVEEIGAFAFTPSGRPVGSVVVNVPGLLDGLTTAGSDDIDQADPDVAAFISAFEDGIATTGGTIQPCDVDENDIVSTAYARAEVKNSGSA